MWITSHINEQWYYAMDISDDSVQEAAAKGVAVVAPLTGHSRRRGRHTRGRSARRCHHI